MPAPEFLDRGSAALGEEIPLGCQCLNSAGTPTNPDAAPTMTIRDGVGATVVSKLIPIQDKFGATGRFMIRQFMTSDFAAGRYWVTYDWTTGAGAYVGASLDTFEVLAGGDANGQFLSLLAFNRPHGRMMIGQTDGGKLLLARNPKV